MSFRDWQVGDRVVCVDAAPHPRSGKYNVLPEARRVYTRVAAGYRAAQSLVRRSLTLSDSRSHGFRRGAVRMIAALYVETGGSYFGLPGVDPWDEARDARKYRGPWPVVAHPPCDRWHQLSAVNHKRWGWIINEDGGCFASALRSVRQWGGVLEHPAETRAFKLHGLPEPSRGGWQKTIEGDWVCEVDQATYGHRARKRTWLLYHGEALPPQLNWSATKGSHQIGLFDQKLPQLPKDERAATPTEFRDLLLSIARTAGQAMAAA